MMAEVKPATDEDLKFWRGLLFNEMSCRGMMLRPDELKSLLARLDAAEKRVKELEEAGRKMITVCLPPHDVSGDRMYQEAVNTFKTQPD
jgi:hypothetical protein